MNYDVRSRNINLEYTGKITNSWIGFLQMHYEFLN